MGTTYEKVTEVCAHYNSNLVDFSACQLINSWGNRGYNLEETIGALQKDAQACQLPITIEIDELGLNAAMIKLAFNKNYSKKLLEFYRNKVLPESAEKTSLGKRIRSWLYCLRVFEPKSLEACINSE